MLKEDLIKRLQDIPGNPEVRILDYKRNLLEADEDGATEGIYSNFEVEEIKPIPEKSHLMKWIALAFKNKYIEEEDEELEEAKVYTADELYEEMNQIWLKEGRHAIGTRIGAMLYVEKIKKNGEKVFSTNKDNLFRALKTLSNELRWDFETGADVWEEIIEYTNK